MATPLVAPYVPTYAATEPYATAAEFEAHPTGVNVRDLVPGGTAELIADAEAQLLVEASSEADGYCNQVLACTTEIEYGRHRVDSYGFLQIPVAQFPIVQVNSLSAGTTGNLSAYTDLSGGTFLGRNILRIPYRGATSAGWVDTQIEYLAGYANTALAAPIAPGATTLTVNDTLGIVPGLAMRIVDPGATETVTVASVTGSVVTLTSATTGRHAAGVAVSALPAVIREATILLAAVKVKSKSAQALTIPSVSGGVARTAPDTTADNQHAAALQLLHRFVRV